MTIFLKTAQISKKFHFEFFWKRFNNNFLFDTTPQKQKLLYVNLFFLIFTWKRRGVNEYFESYKKTLKNKNLLR